MNLWNKITLGTKFLFGGWECALDYLLDFFNSYLAKDGVASKVDKARETAAWALDWMLKIKIYIPHKWRGEYDTITSIIADVISVANDGKLTTEEVKALGAAFAEAKAKWDED